MFGRQRKTICILALIILGLAFFYKTVFFDFSNLDDPAHTSENVSVLTFGLKGLLLKSYLGLYHPLTTISFAIDWWIGGGAPWIFHLSNFIFHILGTLVLFKICLKLWPDGFLLGFLISLTFMLHPLKVESVAWITERKDLLSGLFLWLTIYLYLLYSEREKMWQYIAANLAFLFSVAGKVSVVPLPIFLFVIDWYRSKKLGFRSIINKAPFFVVSLIFGSLNVFEQSRINSTLVFPKKNYTDLFYQIQFYIEKFILPWDLRAWYSPESINFNVLGITSVILLCCLTIFIIKTSSVFRRDIVLGWSLFILFLFPNIKIITPHDANIVNDRYMYIALTGLTFAFFPFTTHTIKYLWINQRRIFSFVCAGIVGIVIIQWLGIAHLQIPYWRDSITLWQHASRFEPNSSIVARHFGKALLQEGRFEEALPYLQKTTGEVEDYANMGYLFETLRKPDEAQNVLLEGLQKYPSHPALLYILGEIKLDHEEYQDALNLFTQALQDPKNELSPRRRAMILDHLGLANMQLGLYREAESFFREALAVITDDAMTPYNLGLVLLKQNRSEEAKGSFQQALKLNPYFAQAYNNIGFIFYQDKNFEQARIWFNRALSADPNFDMARDNLAQMDREKQ